MGWAEEGWGVAEKVVRERGAGGLVERGGEVVFFIASQARTWLLLDNCWVEPRKNAYMLPPPFRVNARTIIILLWENARLLQRAWVGTIEKTSLTSEFPQIQRCPKLL